MPTTHSAVLIVGAGVSGLALALQLGRAGVEVCLVDKAPAPRDKVCGEGIMPVGLRCLAALGVHLRELPGADFDGLDYLAAPQGERGGGVLRHGLRFPPGILGRGLRRTALIVALERAALACPSVRLARDEVRAVEWSAGRVVALRGLLATYRAPVIVAADGVNSRLARWCGARAVRYGERMGLRRHYRLPPERMPARVQVGLLGRHDLYLTPVGEGVLLATTLTGRAGYRAIADRYDAFLREGPYGDVFAAAEPVSELLGWYHPLFHARDYVPGGVLLVGDAGGGIDPCLGMGMSLGLRTAAAAGQAIVARLAQAGPARCLEPHAEIARTARAATEPGPAHAEAAGPKSAWAAAFVAERRRLYLHYHPFGRVFRAFVGSSHGARALLRIMGMLPGRADRLLAIVADLRPWRSLAGRGAAGPRSDPRAASG